MRLKTSHGVAACAILAAALGSSCGENLTERQDPAITRGVVLATLSASNKVFSAPLTQSSGTLAPVQNVAAGGTAPQGLAVDPSGFFAYVADSGSAAVQVYSIAVVTGALSAIETDATGTQPVAVAVDATSSHVYVANKGSNTVTVFSKSFLTGALAFIANVTTGSAPQAVATATGGFVYVANSGDGTISEYSYDSASGSLFLVGTVASGAGTAALLVSGSVLYAVNATAGSVSIFTISASTGALTLLDRVATGTSPSGIALAAPSGGTSLAFVSNKTDSTVSIYSVAGNGDLVAAATVSTGTSPTAIAADPSGTFLLVAGNGSSDILSYRIATSPVGLTLLQDLATGAGAAPLGLVATQTYQFY